MNLTAVASLQQSLDDGTAANVEKISIDGAECAAAVEVLQATDGSRFPKLDRLMLVRGGLTALPRNLGSYASIKQLIVWENKLTDFPESITGCARLSYIHAMNNRLTHIPGALADLPALQELDLCKNTLARLCKRALPSLTKLDVRSNGLTELGDDIAYLSGLETIAAAGNQIASLSDRLATLGELRHLDLTDNQLTDLPGSLAALSLRVLNLNGNPLGIVPSVVFRMKTLSELHLWGCNLTGLSEAIGELAELTFLDASENQLTRFPKALSSLAQLTWLNLADNPGTPESIANLSGSDVAEILAALG